MRPSVNRFARLDGSPRSADPRGPPGPPTRLGTRILGSRLAAPRRVCATCTGHRLTTGAKVVSRRERDFSARTLHAAALIPGDPSRPSSRGDRQGRAPTRFAGIRSERRDSRRPWTRLTTRQTRHPAHARPLTHSQTQVCNIAGKQQISGIGSISARGAISEGANSRNNSDNSTPLQKKDKPGLEL